MALELEDTRAAWERIAAGYDRTNTETQQWLGNESLHRSGLGAGMRFLDVAAGSGALSDERDTIEKTMHRLWEERAGASGVATLGAPINIGWGTK